MVPIGASTAAFGKTTPLMAGTEQFDPVVDPARLLEIERLGATDPGVRAVLQPVVDAAAEQLGAKVALLSVVLPDRQLFAAHRGLTGWMAEQEGTPIEWSFCVNTVRRHAPLVIEDATLHPLVSGSPLIAEGVRSYCGVPLVSSAGYALGALCVIGPDPARFERADLAALRALALEAIAALEARAAAAAAASPR